MRRLITNLFRRSELEATIDEELRGYLDELVERNVRAGMSPAEARRQALIELGGVEQVKEEVRGQWIGHTFETAARDIRYAFRALRRSPGFSAVVVLTLALGIGANVTMFGVMYGVLWRPLPYAASDRLAFIQVDARTVANAGAAPGEVRDIRAQSRTVEYVSMIAGVDANFEYAGEMEHVAAISASNDFLPLLGVQPALGRLLDSQLDEGPDAVRGIVISDALWRRHFAGDPGVIGRGVRVNNLNVQIVGVLPACFRLYLPPSLYAPEQVDVWFPTGIGQTRQYRGLGMLARVKPGMTLAQANAELQSLATAYNGEVVFTARLLHTELTRESRPALLLLAGAVVFMLLIACVNVSNLMLARGAARQRELAIRRALGAGTSTLVRQLLTESLVLAISGGAAGLLLSTAGIEAIARLGAGRLPLESRIAMDSTATLFALALSLGASLLFGVVPAWRLASGGPTDALRAGRSETVSRGTRLLQRALVVAELALSIVPLVCGGLMMRTFANLVNAPIGFRADGIVTAKVPITFRRYPNVEQRWALHRDILERIRAVPGVETVSAASPLPFAPLQLTRRVGRADRPEVPGVHSTMQVLFPGYLPIAGTPLLAGRDFSEEDISAHRPVAMVTERLARQLFSEGALGRKLFIGTGASRKELEIVGITAPVRVTRVRDDDAPHIFVPYHVEPVEMSLVIRTRATAASLAPAIQAAVRAADTGRAAFDIRPLSAYVADSIGDARFTMIVLASFAAACILLASVGLFGTLAYLTSQRSREFGIRLALGSTGSRLISMVLGEGAWLAAAGSAIGLAISLITAAAIRRLLYHVGTFDAPTLAGVVALLALVTIVAAGIPAWRAGAIDPSRSLRGD